MDKKKDATPEQPAGPETAVLYVRVSTEEQTKGYSLQTQEERCREYAESKGYVVVERFLDSQSGEDLNRPDLNRLFSYIIEHPVQVVVVYDTDRLSRGGPYQHGMIEHLLKKSHARIEYVRGDFNEASPESQFSKMIQQTISWYENQQRRERVTRGKMAKARAGRVLVTGLPPTGYRFEDDQMVIDEQEAELVRRVFRMYLEGYSFKKITEQFRAEGIPTKRDGPTTAKSAPTSRTMWFPSTISRILHNRTYTGVWHYNKTSSIKVKGKRNHKARTSAEWLPIPVPAIIDQETYDQAQVIMQNNKILAKRNTKHEYLLRGLIQCDCGYVCHANAQGDRPTYRCPSTTGGKIKPVCDVHFYKHADVVDDAVWRAITEILLDENNLRQAIRAQRTQAQASVQPLEDRLEALQSTRQELERKLQALIDVFLDGSMPRSIAEGRKKLLTANLAALEEEEKRVRGQMAAATLTPKAEESLLDVARAIRQGATELPFEEKRRIVMLLQVKVRVLSKTQMKVSCLLPMTMEVVEVESGNKQDGGTGGANSVTDGAGDNGSNSGSNGFGGSSTAKGLSVAAGSTAIAGFSALGLLRVASAAAIVGSNSPASASTLEVQTSSFVNTNCACLRCPCSNKSTCAPCCWIRRTTFYASPQSTRAASTQL